MSKGQHPLHRHSPPGRRDKGKSKNMNPSGFIDAMKCNVCNVQNTTLYRSGEIYLCRTHKQEAESCEH